MTASPSTKTEEYSVCEQAEFDEYLRVVARAELDRVADDLQSDAYAMAHPLNPRIQRDPSLDDLREDARELQNVIRFLELIEDVVDGADE